MHAAQQHAAEFDFGAAARQELVRANHCVEQTALPGRQFIELRAQTTFEVLHDHRNKGNVSDAITNKSVADELRPQRTQMHDTGSADKWPNETHHEINGMIRRQDTEVFHSRPKWIPSRQRSALLQIVFMREDAALGAAARPGGIMPGARS